ncbi:hypothetical protein B0J12DRAFT_672930 [Macrophomina phaseolina]|uniref:AA1-like domain-containing protein n=1 Tax=Macrophomina phaseolina TaxID=35725 RepID=A0ABQ8G2H4_9PEZI|nr:hypothetical protein B0J12DRAFT_672930 [Macrophomina phaseolina]
MARGIHLTKHWGKAKGHCEAYINISSRRECCHHHSSTVQLVSQSLHRSTNQHSQPTIKMRFFATVAVFGAVALASETVQVKEATIHYNGEAPTAADFTIQPANVKCSSSSAADLASDVAVTCGDSPYRFELRNGGNGELAVTIHKQKDDNSTGLSGTTQFLVKQAEGGNGKDDFVFAPKDDVVSVTLN